MNLFRLMISPLPVPAGWYAFPLRLMIGFGFMQHGYAKLARGPEDFVGILHAMGLPAPALLGWATMLVEIVGGLMILAGLSFHWRRSPWPSSFWSQFSPYICQTGSAPSSCNRSTPPALTSVNPAMKQTCSIWPASSRCASVDPDRSQSTPC
jgi:hypothetical protein